MIAYAASDLMWATRLRSAADELGLPARPTRTIGMLEDRLQDSDVTGVLVDLTMGEEAIGLVRRARAAGLPVVAFGPHVEVEALRAASEAGAEAMPRGALVQRLAEVLARLAGPAGPTKSAPEDAQA